MPTDIIVQFVERKMSADDFIQNLHENSELETVLSEDIPLPRYIKEDNIYIYLLCLNITTPGGLSDSIEILEYFLNCKQIKFEKNDEASKLVSLLMKVEPSWANLSEGYSKKLLKLAEGRTGKETEDFLRAQIRQDFKCSKRTPRWLQSAHWLYEGDRPLMFMGQIDITEVRHDTAQLYIFYDAQNDLFQTVEQVC